MKAKVVVSNLISEKRKKIIKKLKNKCFQNAMRNIFSSNNCLYLNHNSLNIKENKMLCINLNSNNTCNKILTKLIIKFHVLK